jgi:hypothetical protein
MSKRQARTGGKLRGSDRVSGGIEGLTLCVACPLQMSNLGQLRRRCCG